MTAAVLELEQAAGGGDISLSVMWETEQISQARLLVARGDHDEALRLLEELRQSAEAAGPTGKLIEILTLQAFGTVGQTRGSAGALHTLTQALTLAEPEGYVRSFVEAGPAMANLLRATLEVRQRGHADPASSVPARYLAKLLAALAREDAAPAAGEHLHQPVLSERELEVLALIAAGNSNGEIATASSSSRWLTVKTHINNLYRKLGARSRTQADTRAREMNPRLAPSREDQDQPVRDVRKQIDLHPQLNRSDDGAHPGPQ